MHQPIHDPEVTVLLVDEYCADNETCRAILDTGDPEHLHLDRPGRARTADLTHRPRRAPGALAATSRTAGGTTRMMTIPELSAWMDRHFTRAAFRLETRQVYEVASDGSDFRRWLDGEPTWTPERKQPWLDRLAAEHDRGLYRHRVRIVDHPVSDYTRYECEWGYAPNVRAGEDVRILDLDERARPNVGGLDRTDWWLVTDQHGTTRVAEMIYAVDGQFLGAVERHPDDVPTFVAARDALWDAAEPFEPWWNRHSHLRRNTHAA